MYKIPPDSRSDLLINPIRSGILMACHPSATASGSRTTFDPLLFGYLGNGFTFPFNYLRLFSRLGVLLNQHQTA